MGYVGKVKMGGTTNLVGSTLYGTCSTNADVVAKAVTLANFNILIEGVTIHVKFTNENTADSPTLNVNSTGAKPIKIYGTTAPSQALSWPAGGVVSFTYDGTSWITNDWNGVGTITYDYDSDTETLTI